MDMYSSMSKTETPGQYDRRMKARERGAVRRALDEATTGGPVEVHARELASIAQDALTEGKPTIPVLAQIPPFRVGRATYRVFAERVNTEANPARGEIALVCRTRPSTMFQHVGCVCAMCVRHDPEHAGADPATGERQPGRVWYHDATRSFHLRADDGTFTQIPGTMWDAMRAITP